MNWFFSITSLVGGILAGFGGVFVFLYAREFFAGSLDFEWYSVAVGLILFALSQSLLFFDAYTRFYAAFVAFSSFLVLIGFFQAYNRSAGGVV